MSFPFALVVEREQAAWAPKLRLIYAQRVVGRPYEFAADDYVACAFTGRWQSSGRLCYLGEAWTNELRAKNQLGQTQMSQKFARKISDESRKIKSRKEKNFLETTQNARP